MNKEKLCRKFNSVWFYLFFPQSLVFNLLVYSNTCTLYSISILLLVFFLFF